MIPKRVCKPVLKVLLFPLQNIKLFNLYMRMNWETYNISGKHIWVKLNFINENSCSRNIHINLSKWPLHYWCGFLWLNIQSWYYIMIRRFPTCEQNREAPFLILFFLLTLLRFTLSLTKMTMKTCAKLIIFFQYISKSCGNKIFKKRVEKRLKWHRIYQNGLNWDCP